jgi:hypothetical protein
VGRKVLAATDPGEAPGVLAHQSEPDQAAPVLADQIDPGKVEDIEEKRAHPFDVAGEGVLGPRGGLVGAAEADQVGGHHPQSGPGQHRDHVTVQVAPRRLAVEEETTVGPSAGPSSR